MADNELQVRLLHAAKTQDQWKAVTSYPKKGEVCLEAINSSGATAFKIKIGDGTRPYCQNTAPEGETPVWDFTSNQVLPYFGSVIETSGTVNVVAISTYNTTKKKLSFYTLGLSASTSGGSTTITPTIASSPYLEIIEGTGVEFTTDETGTIKKFYINLAATTEATATTITDGGTFTTITPDSNHKATKYTTFTLPSIADAIAELDTDSPLALVEYDSSTTTLSIYTISETDGVISKSSTAATTIDLSGVAPVQDVQINSTSILDNSGNANLAVEGTYNASSNKIATESTVSDAIEGLDVNGYAQAEIDTTTTSGQTTLTIKGIEEVNGEIAVDTTNNTSIVIDGTYNASTNKIATESTVSDVIATLDGNATTTDITSSHDVIVSVSETDGIVSSAKKTLVAGDKIDIDIPTTGTSIGDIIISHEDIDTTATDVASTITTDTSSVVDEKELSVITGIKVDAQGHITHIDKDVSTNLVAADIKSPVEMIDDEMWTYRPTGGDITIDKDIANVTDVKGKTLVWNQLLKQGKLVDLGLPSGLLWATSNIDITQEDGFAESPFQYGCTMFSWGNIEGHNTPATGTTFDYNFGGVNAQEPWYEGRPYGETTGNALTANIVAGDTQDAARYNLGSLFKIPASEQFQELFNNCNFVQADGTTVIDSSVTDKRVTINGVVGIYLKSKVNGNLIFFSASGYGSGSSWNSCGANGNYWSASFFSARNARCLYFVSDGVYSQTNDYRYYGFAVRAVVNPNTVEAGHNNHKYFVTKDINVDLTLMFSAGNEPSTVEEFEALYPLGYYNYNTGTLINNNASAIETTGFNQWDEEWERGAYDFTTGDKSVENTTIRCTNLIPVLPNTQYYCTNKTTATANGTIAIFYDADGTFITNINSGQNYINIGNKLFTTPVNAAFMSFYTVGTTYNNDICINLSDPAKNSTYEPYEKHTFYFDKVLQSGGSLATVTGKLNGVGESVVVFPEGLKSANSVYDEIKGNVAIKRIGSREYTSGDESDATVITDGTNTYYALTTPETYILDQTVTGNYIVDDNGTEKLLPEGVDSTTGLPLTTPFSGIITYQSNFKDVVLDTVDKVSKYKNPVRSKEDKPQTTGKVAVYDSDSTVKSSTFEISNTAIDPECTYNETTVPTIDAVVDYIEDVVDTEVTVQDITTTDDDISGNGGIRITNTGTTYDVHHADITQSADVIHTITPEEGDNNEAVVKLVTGVITDDFGHVKGKEVISSDKLIAADIKAPMTFTDKDTWLIRPTACSHDVISEDVARVTELEGNSVVWNQLAAMDDISNTANGVTFTRANGKIILSGTASGNGTFYVVNGGGLGGLAVRNGHKGIVWVRYISGEITGTHTIRLSIGDAFTDKTSEKKIFTVSTSGAYLVISFEEGAVFTDYTIEYQLFDLTNIFDSGNEPATVEGFESWLAKNVGLKPSYGYNEGSLLSAQTLGIKTYGQNLLNPNTRQAKLIPYEWEDNSNVYTIKNVPSGATVTFTPDATGVAETVDISGGSLDITSYGSGILELSAATVDTYVCMKWDEQKDDDVVPYEDNTYDFDVRKVYGKVSGAGEYVQCFPNGMKSAGTAKDSLTASEAVVRIGSRAYQSGDESDNTVITDGTNTLYTLSTPITYTDLIYRDGGIDRPLADVLVNINVNNWGIEEQLLTPYVDDNPTSTAATITMQYKSNFKDAIKDLIDKVNNQKNPVMGVSNTGQTVDKIAIYDSASTVHSSSYSPSNATIVENATGNNIILPSVETIVNYVNSKLSSALTYKGVFIGLNNPNTSSTTFDGYIDDVIDDVTPHIYTPNTGDMYIVGTSFTISDNDGIPYGNVQNGTYNAGDFFIWNGSSWDIVSGTTSVVNNDLTINFNDASVAQEIGTVDGTSLTIKAPNLNFSDPDASSTGSLTFIDSVSQSNGLISATKKPVRSASTSQSGVVTLSSGIETTSNEDSKIPTAYDTLTNLNNRDVDSGTITNDIASLSKRMVDDDSGSQTYGDWINKPFYPRTKLAAIDSFTTDFATAYPDLAAIEALGSSSSTSGFPKRASDGTWSLDQNVLTKYLAPIASPGTDYTFSDPSSNDVLENLIHDYYTYGDYTNKIVTKVKKASLTNTKGFAIDVPILSSTSATAGTVLKGVRTDNNTGLPIWANLSIEELSELNNLSSNTGYLKRTSSGTGYTWSLDTPVSTTVISVHSDQTPISSSTASAGIKVTTNGDITYHKISVSALINDTVDTLILNGNFS